MKENKLKNWIKSHKSELLIVGCVVITAVGAAILIKNYEKTTIIISKEIKEAIPCATDILFETSSTCPSENSTTLKIIDVREHLRTLPNGCHPSPQKVSEAIHAGIDLADNQTLVAAYQKYCVA